MKKRCCRALTFAADSVNISTCDADCVLIEMRKSYKNKQSIHSHPAASLAGVQTFVFLNSAEEMSDLLRSLIWWIALLSTFCV